MIQYCIDYKNFSDRQILIDKKLVNYIVKNLTDLIKISDFIYKIIKITKEKNLQILK